MPIYIYMEEYANRRNGNVNIRVYKIRCGKKPKFIGQKDFYTALWKGSSGAAAEIISKVEGYKTNGYSIQRQDVGVYKL